MWPSKIRLFFHLSLVICVFLPVIDQKFKEKLGTAGSDKIINDKSSIATRDESSTGTPKTDGEADDEESEEPEEEEKPAQETEEQKKTATKEPVLKSLAEIAKVS